MILYFVCVVPVLQVRNKIRQVKTIYDCQADNDDELTFAEGEVIIVTGEEDQEWWLGNTSFIIITVPVMKTKLNSSPKSMLGKENLPDKLW